MPLTKEDKTWLEAKGAKEKNGEWSLNYGHFIVTLRDSYLPNGVQGVCCGMSLVDTGVTDYGTYYSCCAETAKAALDRCMAVMNTRWGRMAEGVNAMTKFAKELKGDKQ